METIKTPEVQNLEHDAAQIEEKLTANRAALDSARNVKHIATMNAAENAHPENRADLRAAILEVDALEAVKKELDRRAVSVARELEKERATAKLEHEQRELRALLSGYVARREQTFELRAQIALAFDYLPELCRELHALELEETSITDRACALQIEGEGDFQQIAGEGERLLWQTRDEITGEQKHLEIHVQAILNAVTRQVCALQTEHLVEMGLANLRSLGEPRRAPTESERNQEADNLEAYRRGDRTREPVFAHQRDFQRIQTEAEAKTRAEAAGQQKPQRASLLDVQEAYRQARAAA